MMPQFEQAQVEDKRRQRTDTEHATIRNAIYEARSKGLTDTKIASDLGVDRWRILQIAGPRNMRVLCASCQTLMIPRKTVTLTSKHFCMRCSSALGGLHYAARIANDPDYAEQEKERKRQHNGRISRTLERQLTTLFAWELGLLSEGQAASALGVDRLALRQIRQGAITELERLFSQSRVPDSHYA